MTLICLAFWFGGIWLSLVFCFLEMINHFSREAALKETCRHCFTSSGNVGVGRVSPPFFYTQRSLNAIMKNGITSFAEIIVGDYPIK